MMNTEIQSSSLRQSIKLIDSSCTEIDAIIKNKNFLNNIPISMAIFDTKMNYLFANERWIQFYKTPKEIIGLNHYQIFPDIPEEWKKSHARGINGESINARIDYFIGDDYQTKMIKWSIFPWFDENNQVGGIVLTTDDLSDLQQIIEKLRMSENNFHQLAESMPQMVWMTRSDGINIYSNQRWSDYTGQTQAESLGENWNKPFHPEDKVRAIEQWKKATTELTSYELEVRICGKDGVYKWWLVRGVPLFDTFRKVDKWFGTCTDIDKIKQNEINLRKSEEIFRLLVESTEDYAIFMLSPQGNIETWNLGAEKLKGYKQEEIIGKSFSLFYGPEDVIKNVPDFELDQARKFGKCETEGIRYRKDGSSFLAHVIITTLYDNEKKIRGFSKVTHDITISKKQEEDKKIRELFVLSIIHDLKNPLSIMKMNTEMIQKASQGLTKIIANIDRADKMISNLMDINKVGKGKKLVQHLEYVNLQEIIKNILTDFSLLYGDRFQFSCPKEISGFWSHDGLIRIIENMLNNAVKYGAPKSIVTIRLEKTNEQIICSVHNFGEEIPKEQQNNIFNFSERLKKSESSNISGWGIGLNLTKKIIEEQGGKINLTSTKEEGTTFTFNLPLDARPFIDLSQ